MPTAKNGLPPLRRHLVHLNPASVSSFAHQAPTFPGISSFPCPPHEKHSQPKPFLPLSPPTPTATIQPSSTQKEPSSTTKPSTLSLTSSTSTTSSLPPTSNSPFLPSLPASLPPFSSPPPPSPHQPQLPIPEVPERTPPRYSVLRSFLLWLSPPMVTRHGFRFRIQSLLR
ncbi:hypothetical protein HPP92_006670 [Vanilla planifolia]|uniref:Uncharacterized protein n=1 Tax=Vanilla planifolia TaxID=51239 RepID=A0A835RF82_VANPL|nr:hypothetical protein HPP92_006670 [Vanilla planifolia]